MSEMSRAQKIALGLAALAAVVIAGAAWREQDLAYRASEILSLGRYDSHDADIAMVARRHGVDPLLVKAVIWQESRFDGRKLGTRGERGLMQVTEPAAQDWVRAKGIETFVPEDLLDEKTNLEVGTWYLSEALKHWSAQEEPVPFALGEYNAGRSRVRRWSGGSQMSPEELSEAMDIASTRAYIAAVRKRYDYYKQRGDRLDAPD